MLDVLQKSGVTDVVVVATRYFGGILLGGGGLVRAYSHTASIALQAAGIVTMRECLMLRVVCDYSQYGRVAALVPECGGVVDDTVFEEKVALCFHMAPEDRGGFDRPRRRRPGKNILNFASNFANKEVILEFAAYNI